MTAERSIDIRLAEVLGSPPVRCRALAGGCINAVQLATLEDGRSVVVKHAAADTHPQAAARTTQAEMPAGFLTEARMLTDLARFDHIPVPGVLHAEPGMLVLEHIPNDGVRTPAGTARFAESLAALHTVTQDRFGLNYTTPIGSLPQNNRPNTNWADFFAQCRLLPLARVAVDRGGITAHDAIRIDRMCAHMEELIGEPPARPSLIHGDLWAGNVLWNNGDLAAVIDPALCYADAEIELAFIDLMGSVDAGFWTRYAACAPIRPGFWEHRRDLYNIYPLLVHAALFGGGYGASAMGRVRDLGF